VSDQKDFFENLIKRCNNVLFRHMYSRGQLEFASDQHRDLVRSFFAGAFEMLIELENKYVAGCMIEEYRKMSDINWRPDRRFFWNPEQ
jgi:hypothetical protein